jgi:hypothetical protein
MKMMSRAMESKKKSKKCRKMMFSENEDDFINQQRVVNLKREEFAEKEKTSEYMETHYKGETNLSSFKSLVSINQFWCDYASYLLTPENQRGPFLSSNFTDCAFENRQSILAFMIMDLPFKLEKSHDFEIDESSGVTIKAASNVILYKKSIQDAPIDLKNDLMVIHRYQKIEEKDNTAEQPTEFLTNTPYKCEVIITNVSPQSKKFSLLYQIPLGSMPLSKTKNMKSHYMELQPYTTKKVTFDFYFPQVGMFSHFPSNVSIEGLVHARGGASIMKVVEKHTTKEIKNF